MKLFQLLFCVGFAVSVAGCHTGANRQAVNSYLQNGGLPMQTSGSNQSNG